MLDESNAKFYYTLIAIGFVLVFCYAFATGIKIGCDGPPLEEVALVIGEPCPPAEPAPETEKVIVYRTETVYQPVIGLETVKFLGWMFLPISCIGVGLALALAAIWMNEKGLIDF
jgi:hypothetical protein